MSPSGVCPCGGHFGRVRVSPERTTIARGQVRYGQPWYPGLMAALVRVKRCVPGRVIVLALDRISQPRSALYPTAIGSKRIS